jgi:hypothetical protein
VTGESEHLYVIGEGGGCGIVKIGRSSDPRIRLSSVQTGNPKRMQLLLVVPGAGEHEKALHDKFSVRHIGGEWFNFAEDDPVAAVQDALDEILRPKPKPKPRSVIPRAKAPTGPPRQTACKEAGCDVTAAAVGILGAVHRWFLDNHPDPAAYLLEQGVAWHCIEDAFRDELPAVSVETIRQARDEAAAA